MPTLAKKYLKAMLVILEGESAPMPREPYLIHAIQSALKPKRSLAPARKRREAKKKTRRDKASDLRAKVFERANGRCEYCAEDTPTDLEHFWGGSKRRSMESVESCLAVCRTCHAQKHNNLGGPDPWLSRFISHCVRHGYSSQIVMACSRLESLELQGRAS